MAVSFYLSGGANNSDPTLSLGGTKSSAAATGIGLFTAPLVAATSRNFYRCIYVQFDTSVTNAVLWLKSDTPGTGTAISFGWGAAVGATDTTVANQTTAPAGITFSSPTTKSAAIAAGDMPAGQSRALWIRYAVSAGTEPQSEAFVLAAYGAPGVALPAVLGVTSRTLGAALLQSAGMVEVPLTFVVPATIFLERSTTNTTYALSQYVTGGQPPYISYELVSGTLPAGVTLNTTNGQLTISSTAALGTVPGFSFAVTDSDIATNVTMTATLGAATLQASAVGPTQSIVDFGLLSTASGTDIPFTFGHAFKEGDVPTGRFINSDLTDWQAVPTNYWPDGSVRHAIIAGLATCTANVKKTVSIARATADRPGAALAQADLAAALPPTTLTFGAETISVNSLVSTSALSRTVCTGPIMSNFIYRRPITGSNHLVAWFDCRVYKGGTTEVFPWIENAYLGVASPASTASTAITFSMGGTQRYSGSIVIPHHSRIAIMSGAFSHWSSTTPSTVTPVHNTTYLMATKMVPNYSHLAPSAATLNGLQQSFVPNTLAGQGSDMGSTGFSASILQNQQAFYVTSGGDARAYRSMVTYGMSGGSWPVHFRDQNSNEPIRFSDHPNATIDNLPEGTGTSNGGPDRMHQPGFGFLPWLMTGRWFFLDEHVFWATWNYLSAQPEQRRGMVYQQNTGTYPAFASSGSAGIIDGRNGTYANRGGAWSIRTLAQSLAILPSTHTCYASFKNAYEQTFNFLNATYVAGTHIRFSGPTEVSPFGYLWEHSDNQYSSSFPAGQYGGGIFMIAQTNQSIAYVTDLKLSSSVTSAENAVVQHALKFTVGLAGGVNNASGWNYRRFGLFSAAIGTEVGGLLSYYPTFAQMLSSYETKNNIASQPNTPGLSLFDHSTNTPLTNDSTAQTYLPQQLAALAYAVDKGVPGAQEGWDRVAVNATNISVATSGFNNNPSYAFKPRT